jgi:hypothetical protein
MKTTNQENETFSYWRNPQKEEIKLGYGAIHFRDFEKEQCFNEDGSFKLALITNDDRLKYYSCNHEYFITSKYKIR